MKKGFFKWQRNPFKLWRSYLGAVIFGFIPLPLIFVFAPAWLLLYASLSSSFGILMLVLLISLPIIFSGFFLAAATKKGKDNFLQYGITLFILEIIILAVLNNGGLV